MGLIGCPVLINFTQSLAHAVFLGLAKVRTNQIHSTEVISTNQKCMYEGIPSLHLSWMFGLCFENVDV